MDLYFAVIVALRFILLPSQSASYSSVAPDDPNIPFAFSSDLYNTVLIRNGENRQYLRPLDPHMGVPEPFSGNPSGHVLFSIIRIVGDGVAFSTETAKAGNFFFLRIYADAVEFAKTRSLYSLSVEAVFTHDSSTSSGLIQLRNTTTVLVNVLDPNDHCPFFSKLDYSFEVTDSSSVHSPIGRVSITDDDSGFNTEAYFYLDPLEDGLPFFVHPYTGDIYLTWRSIDSYLRMLPPGRNHSGMIDGRTSFSFKVYATRRGNSSSARCTIISSTIIRVHTRATRYLPSIFIEPLTNVSPPGLAGTAYALLTVVDKASNRSVRHGLQIVEPNLREYFELIPTLRPSEWLLEVRRNLPSISLFDNIVLTLASFADMSEHDERDTLRSLSSSSPESRRLVQIPVVSKSTYRLYFPTEIVVTVSEAELVNCTITVLTPHVSYRMTNSTFAFSVLSAPNTKSGSTSLVSLSPSGAVILHQPFEVDISTKYKESMANYTKIVIPFTVIDRNNILLSSAAKSNLIIQVVDVNDNDPVVRNNGSVYEVTENAFIGTVVLRIDAFDPDLSNSKLLYVLYNSQNIPFRLTPDGGLVVSKALDAETMPNDFTVFISVSDSGIPLPRTVLAVFTIHLLDVNEYSPRFVELSCEASLRVSEAGFLTSIKERDTKFILWRYTAEDADRDGQNHVIVRLASSSLARSCFSVDGDTGELSVVCPHLGPPNSDIILTLMATDGSKVSEGPLELKIHLVSSLPSRVNFTQRCQPSGIYNDIQHLKTRRSEYEMSLIFTPTFSNIVTNLHRPKFPADLPTRLHIPENLPLGTSILQLTASDEDSGEYSMAGQLVYGIESVNSVSAENSNTASCPTYCHQAFSLRPIVYAGDPPPIGLLSPRGVLVVAVAPLDREKVFSYELILRVCDLGEPQLCAFSPLSVYLVDLDDNPPRFLATSGIDDDARIDSGESLFPHVHRDAPIPGVLRVSEDSRIDTRIGHVKAVDDDVTSEVRYTLRTHTDTFKIHQRTGRIRLLRKLDRETQSTYELIIEASGQPRRNQPFGFHTSPQFARLLQLANPSTQPPAVTRVVVFVTDVNDNPPVFISPGLLRSSLLNGSTLRLLDAPGYSGYDLFVPTDMPQGAYLTTLVAVDADEGRNGLVWYSLFGDPKGLECFFVERLTGVMRLTTSCDLSILSGQSILLTAWASDHGSPQLSANSSLSVHIIPVRMNTLPPSFGINPALYLGTISEHDGMSLIVVDKNLGLPLRLEATDPDGGTLSLVITGGSGIGFFQLDNSGFIWSIRSLDAESLPDEGGYWLTVCAVKQIWASSVTNSSPINAVYTELTGPMRALAEVFIEVTDINDNYPIPSAPEFVGSLPENSPPGLVVATVSATDADRTSLPLLYRISAGDPQGHFTIDSKSGSVYTTTRPIDRELLVRTSSTDHICLVVSISDQGSPEKTVEVNVRIVVFDANDHTPRFLPLSPNVLRHSTLLTYYFRVYDSEQDSTLGCVGRVFAVDLDDSLNGTVVYWRDRSSKFDGNNSYSDGGFDVHPETGDICSSFFPLQPGEYEIRIFAKDQGQPQRVANDNISVVVHVTVLQSPSSGKPNGALHFTDVPPKVFIIQGSRTRGSKLFTFSVLDSLDQDGTILTYSLSTPNGSRLFPFCLNLTSHAGGYVLLTESLPRDLEITYQILLTVSNGFQRLTSRITISIKALDIFGPKFLPKEFGKHSAGQISVTQTPGSTSLKVFIGLNESVLVGSLVCQLVARTHTYFEGRSTLEYTVVSVGQVATRFSFSLNNHTGELRIARPLDHESVAWHSLLIAVRDAQRPTLSCFVQVFINVSDINEYAPLFVGFPVPLTNTSKIVPANDHLVFYTSGTASVGTVVGRVTAIDLDHSDTGCITYSLIGGDTVDYFSIDPMTGELRLTKSLLPHHDSDTFLSGPQPRRVRTSWSPEHRILVSATDNNKYVSRSNHTQVIVRIVPGPGDIDAPPPEFTSRHVVHFTVNENLPPGYIIASLGHFLTPESAVYGFIQFDLISSEPVGTFDMQGLTQHGIQSQATSDLDLFQVASSTGFLVTAVRLDREQHGDFHRLLVQVRGAHGIRRKVRDYLVVEIQILDVNDNPPAILSPRYIRGCVFEDAQPGSLVLQSCTEVPIGSSSLQRSPVHFYAFDPDLGLNGRIKYELIEPYTEDVFSIFSIDHANGLLRLSTSASLDRESMSHYLLTLQVSDSGSPPLTANSLIRIEVEVLDVNDCPPIFSELFYTSTLILPTYPSELIAQLQAVDPDVNDSVSYRLADNVWSTYFTVDSHTGRLLVAPNSSLLNLHSLFVERTYLLVVEAFDTHLPHPHVTRANVTVFAQISPDLRGPGHTLIVDPEDGLDVSFPEHYNGNEPLFLGQLSVRDAPVGAIHKFVVLTPSCGVTVDRSTGAVLATGDQPDCILDREVTPHLTLYILVRDMHHRTGRTTVRVHLLDINDHAPSFVGAPYHIVFCLSLSFDDRPSSGSKSHCQQNHFSVTAVDMDDGINGSFTFHLENIHPRVEPPLIAVDSQTGQLKLLRHIPPDWTGRQLDASVVATDGGGLSSTASITIQLVFADGPRFLAPHYTVSIPESSQLGEAVTTVEATSASPSASLIYRLTSIKVENSSSGSERKSWSSIDLVDSPFTLEFNTAYLNTGPCLVRLIGPLDYESASNYVLLLEVLDTSTGLTARAYLSINVTDVNDVAPRFLVPEHTLFVSENENAQHALLLLVAIDPDTGYGGQVMYTLEAHGSATSESSLPSPLNKEYINSLSYFACDSETGLLTLARKLDYRVASTHRLWAVATDRGAIPLSSRIPITIHVLDHNDHPPQFDFSDSLDIVDCRLFASLDPRAAPGTFVMRVLASDADVNDTLSYRVLPSDTGHTDYFRLRPDDGVLLWAPFRTLDGKVSQHPLAGNPAWHNFNDSFHHSVSIAPFQDESFFFEVEVSDGLHLSKCEVHIELDSVNWESPKFPAPNVEVWNIPEVATHLGRIQLASDADRGDYGKVTYTLIGGHDRDVFRLDSFTGDLRVLEPLDRESIDHYVLMIRASDGGNLFDYMTLDLHISDVNDNRPVFLQPSYEITLFPHEYDPLVAHFPYRTSLCVQASDADMGSNAQLVYRIFRPPISSLDYDLDNGASLFTLDSETGCLSLNAALSNSTDEIHLFAEACDTPTDRISDVLCSSPVGIVARLAKRSPSFIAHLTCSSLPIFEDDFLLDRNVAACHVHPANATGSWSLAYTVSKSGVQVAAFRIDPLSGQLYNTKPMDYETGHCYHIGVQFELSDASPVLLLRTELRIDVIDTNDCSPVFDSAIYTVRISEDAPIDSHLIRAFARDADMHGGDTITYSLWPLSVSESDLADLFTAHPFSIEARLKQLNYNSGELEALRDQFEVHSSGWVTLKSSLDYERSREHKFKIVASDSAGHWNSSAVIVTVIDVNDNPPHWPLKETSDDSLEDIIFSDVLRRQILQANISIAENWFLESNSSIYQLYIVDPDVDVPSTPTFSLFPESSNSFFSVSRSGAVHLRRPLDHELVSSYALKFQASDGLYVTKDSFVLHIDVLDANDNAPVCMEPERDLTLPEDTPQGTIVTRVVAIDADGDQGNSNLVFKMTSGTDGLFAVDPSTGVVRLQGSLDFETKRSHEFSIRVEDDGQFNCLFLVRLLVLDVNDNPPKLDPIFINPVPEDVPVGSLIGKITARDLDFVDTGRLYYSLRSSHEASFSIEPHTGLLKVSRSLDRETTDIHKLTVVVTDGFRLPAVTNPSSQFTSTASFTVRLLDVNDSPPQFVNTSSHKIRVSELAPVGLHLLRIEAVSLDEGMNAVIRYKLLTNQPEFSLNETTGDLLLASTLDHEHIPSYFLTVEARDQGSPPLSTTAVIVVKVVDENDNRPQFVGQQPVPTDLLAEDFTDSEIPNELIPLLRHYYSFNVVENSRTGTVVGKVKAVDADEGENGRLLYRLSTLNITPLFSHIHQSASIKRMLLTTSEAQSYFSIVADSGEIALLFEPDRESLDELWLAATVFDHGTPHAFTADTLIRIRVLDVNDCPPVFDRPSYEFTIRVDRTGTVSECFEVQPSVHKAIETTCGQAIGGRVLIAQLRVTDEDSNPNAGPFTCQLIFAGAPQIMVDPMHVGHLFFVRNVSSASKNLTATKETHHSGECLLYAADRLPIGSQSLVLRANDNGLTALHTTVAVTVHVVRLDNLPPEIVKGNATLTYYRGTQFLPQPASTSVSASSAHSFTDVVVARVIVEGKTAHDRLTFELLPGSSASGLFRVDKYDGSIRTTYSPTAHLSATAGTEAGSATPTSYGPPGTPFSHLDSGLYPVRVRVSNGSLASEETLFIQVITITDDMMESAVIVRISNLLPSLFYMENYDRRLRIRLASSLFPSSHQLGSSSVENSISRTEDVYILAVQESDPLLLGSGSALRRTPRSLGRSIDVLIAVYDSEHREFITPRAISEAVTRVSTSISAEFNGQVEVIYDVCTLQFCPRGRCVTRIAVDPHALMNRIEIHRVSQVSPRFTMFPTCLCPPHFNGLRCDIPSDACATATCPAPRICIPRDRKSHVCVCPPPRTGPNCESVQPIVGQQDSCYTEQCFNDREYGPLQFDGGSFIHWELINPQHDRFELAFRFRTRQRAGTLVAVRWNALRTFHIRLATGGRLVVSSTGLNDGLFSSDWLVSATPLSDGLWHHIRLVLITTDQHIVQDLATILFHVPEDSASRRVIKNPPYKRWWVELTVDGIQPRSAFIHWELSDPRMVGILLGADPVRGFGPLAPRLPLTAAPILTSTPQLGRRAVNYTTDELVVLRSGIVGCFRDIRINKRQPPYQFNFQVSVARALSESMPFTDTSNVLLMRAHQLIYECDPSATVSGPCASGPCLHGGSCVPKVQRNSTIPYICHCPALFRGHQCERTSDACLLKPCQNGGSCQTLFSPTTSHTSTDSGLAAYRCVCPVGVSGVHCEEMRDGLAHSGGDSSSRYVQTKVGKPACFAAHLVLRHSRLRTTYPSSKATPLSHSDVFSLPDFNNEPVCLNGGECLDSTTGAYCSCPLGWQGARCEHDVNECELTEYLFSNQNYLRITHLTHPQWAESHGFTSSNLCSSYEVGRGICVNTPGSYRCNCTLGFTGRYCQTKNLIQLTPDTNVLGLTQLHVYVIVSVLAFLFLAALTIIVILACRARGFTGSSLEHDDRGNKLATSYLWSSGSKQCLQHKSTGHYSVSRLHPYGHSDSGNFLGVPFRSASPGRIVNSHRMGTNASSHGFSSCGVARRRPSLVSSTFTFPVNGNGSTTALLSCPVNNNMKHDSESSADPTLTDYMDRDDCSTTDASRLLLYPSSGGDPVPVVMMMSPSAGNRTNLLSRYSPSSSVVYYGPAPFLGNDAPPNHGSSSYIGYNLEPPGSACVPSRQRHSALPVAFYPSGPLHPVVGLNPAQSQLYGLRPGSVVGSDKLSLGSGSDRFSAHSSQVLMQPANGVPVPFSYQLGHPQLQQQVSYPGYPVNTYDSFSLEQFEKPSERAATEAATQTLRASDPYFGTANSHLENFTTSALSHSITPGCTQYSKPRPLPANLHHLNHLNHSVDAHDAASTTASNGTYNCDSSLDNEATPKLCRPRSSIPTDDQTLRRPESPSLLDQKSVTYTSQSHCPELARSDAADSEPKVLTFDSDRSLFANQHGATKLSEYGQQSSQPSPMNHSDDVKPFFNGSGTDYDSNTVC